MTSTLVSWGITLTLLGAVTYYYNPNLFQSLLSQSQPARSSSPVAEVVPRPSNKRSKSKKSAASRIVDEAASTASKIVDKVTSTKLGTNETSSKKRKIASPSTQQIQSQGVDDEDVDDKEFAQQLARTQTGTKLQKSTSQPVNGKKRGAQQPQVKQPQVANAFHEISSTREPSDDDESLSANAPPATSLEGQGQTARAGDISDMLEAPTSKPTTLRLTGVVDESKVKKPAVKSFEPVMSKKQRQQQAKKEEMRQMREESDRLHEAKKQEQLRRARMADGTSNQTKANNFSGSSSNAWQSKNNEAVKAAPTESAPLLDTFDPSSISAAKPNGAVHTLNLENISIDSAAGLKDTYGEERVNGIAASTREGLSKPMTSWSDEMDGEEHLKLLKQQEADAAWEDVTNKKTKRKAKKESDTASETSSSVHKSALVLSSLPVNGAKMNTSYRSEVTNRFDSIQTNDKHSLADADWEA